MTNDNSLIEALYAPIELLPHDPRWASTFLVEQSALMRRCPTEFVAVEHIGSTAIPGIQAKPIIDMLAGVATFNQLETIVEQLCSSGYLFPKEFNQSDSNRKFFLRCSSQHRTHHLHIVIFGSDVWNQHLFFRDYLRDHPDDAAIYDRLKHDLAVKFRDDREAYTNAKSEFVKSILAHMK